MNALSWSGLPTELKLAIFHHLPKASLVSVGLTSRANHTASVNHLYRAVRLTSVEDAHLFLSSVPRSRMQLIRELTIVTRPDVISFYGDDYLPGPWDLPLNHETHVSDLIRLLLTQCSQLEALDLRLYGTLLPSVIPAFESLSKLDTLRIRNCASEEHLPIGERLVVSLASAAPTLTHLFIAGIARSLVHAPELLGAQPLVPISDDSQDEFTPSRTCPELCLPELLALPNLRSLSIQDTHLGDPKWKVAPVSASFELLILGAPCAFAAATAVQEHAEDLLTNPALVACKTVCDPSLGVLQVVSACSSPAAPSKPLASAARSSRFASLAPLIVDLPAVSSADALEAITPGLSASSLSSSSSSGPASPASYPGLALSSHVEYLPLNHDSEDASLLRQDYGAKNTTQIVPIVVITALH